MSTSQLTPAPSAPSRAPPARGVQGSPVGSRPTPSAVQSGTAIVGSARRLLARISDDWLPRVAWSLQRTGRLGLSGTALLVAGGVFLVSTYLPLTREVEELRSQAESARVVTATGARPVSDPGTALLRTLPSRAQVPSLLGMLLKQADAAHLSIDSGKYETTALKSGGVTSYQVSFPVSGPYPQVRQFIDTTLTELPSVALSELSLTRKTIGDGSVEAQMRLTFFTREGP
jgi:hypothetical protein